MFRKFGEKVVIGVLTAITLGAIYAAWDALKNASGRFFIPPGAVVAFSGACPESGWEKFEKLGGRFIIGAGPHSNKDGNGNSLKEFAIGDDGGEVSQILSNDHLPEHSHGLAYLSNDAARYSDAKTGTNSPYFNLPAGQAANRAKIAKMPADKGTLTAGNGKPLTNIPPYLSLSYCIKKE